MLLPRTQFLKACAEIGFRSEAKLLWRGLGKDEVGVLSFEELDIQSAVLLAHFQLFVTQTFGSAAAAFRSLDRTKTKKLRRSEFVWALQEFGFKYRAKRLFHAVTTLLRRMFYSLTDGGRLHSS